MVFNTLKEIGSRQNVAGILLLLAIATAKAQVANNLEEITIVGNSAEQTVESVSSSDPSDGYEHFMIRYHLPAGKVNAKNRVVVKSYLIDCNSGMVVDSLEPFVIEGKKYRKRRIRRNDYPRYEVSNQIIEDGKELNIDTTLIVRKLNNKQGHRRVDYTVTLEDYHKAVSSYTHTGSCLLRRPFKFLLPTSFCEILPSDESYHGTKFKEIEDPIKRDSITKLAYQEIIQKPNYYLEDERAPYVCNQYAIMQMKRGNYDVEILRPFIDFNRYGNGRIIIDVYRWTESQGKIPWNRHEIVLNQAIAYLMEQKIDTVFLLIDGLERREIKDKSLKDLEAIIHVKRLHFVGRTSREDRIYQSALATVLENDYNKAVLYTELEDLEKRNEAMVWVDKIDDTNPTKWYLKAILWADKAGKEPLFDGTPYYLAFLHHCLQLAPDYADHYRFDANFSDELRQKYPYKQGDAEKYTQLFKKIIITIT